MTNVGVVEKENSHEDEGDERERPEEVHVQKETQDCASTSTPITTPATTPVTTPWSVIFSIVNDGSCSVVLLLQFAEETKEGINPRRL